MFDGVDHATLFAPDAEDLASLYVGHLGFTEVARARLPVGSAQHDLWRLPACELDVRTLEKPGSAGGGLRLVGAPELPAVDAPRSMRTPGPFALDFYVRDLRGLHDELSRSGWTFRSEPVSYPLFGTEFSVDEVLLEAPLGLVHAFVEFLPGRHRCVLGDAPDERVSELVAAITVVPDVDDGLRTLRDALGGQVYFDEVFRGEAIEQLVGLPRGAEFRAVLLRGPRRRNARAELMEVVSSAPADDVDRPRSVILSVGVDDVAGVLDRLPGDVDVVGPLVPKVGPHAGRTVATLWPTWAGVLELVERT